MTIKVNKTVVLEDVRDAVYARTNNPAYAKIVDGRGDKLQPVSTVSKLFTSYFLVNKESEYTDHNLS